MKSLFTIIISLLFAYNLAAQSSGKTFYLKNGSIVSGQVTEEIPGKQYTVKTSDGNTFIFKAEEVERIVLNQETEKTQKEVLPNEIKFYSQNGITGGAMFTDNYNSYNVGLNTINGININNRLQVGLGLELQLTEKGTYIPIYLDSQFNFTPTASTFFAHVSAGVAISNTGENLTLVNVINGELFETSVSYQNGFFGRFGLGYKMPLSEKLDALIGLDYSAISYESRTYLYADQYLELEGIYSIVGLRIGVEF